MGSLNEAYDFNLLVEPLHEWDSENYFAKAAETAVKYTTSKYT